MPLVRIDMIRGRSPEQVGAVADAVQHALVDVLRIPERDRFQIVTQHDADEIVALDAGLGFERGPGAVIVHIFTQRGRGVEEKQRLTRRSPSGSRQPASTARTCSSASSRTARRTGRSPTAARSTSKAIWPSRTADPAPP